MSFSIYQNFHTETLREANALLEFEADELGVSVERLIGIQVKGFDRELMQRIEAFDMLGPCLGSLAPKKRFLQVDYKEKGCDMHRSLAVYPPDGMDDGQMVSTVKQSFEGQRLVVSSIVEVDSKGRMIAVHYVRPGFLKECRQDMIKMFQGRD